MRLRFTVEVSTIMQSYEDDAYTQLHKDDIAHQIEAAIWKNYADPSRRDAGILAVLSVTEAPNV